jgi:hypothetical protein
MEGERPREPHQGSQMEGERPREPHNASLESHAQQACKHATQYSGESHTKRRRWLTVLRLTLGACLLTWLLYRVPYRDLAQVIQSSLNRWPWWVLGTAAAFCGLTAASFRWHLILRSQQFNLKWPSVFRFFFIGQFFNAFLPGGCGGDLVRAYYVARITSRRRTQAVSTVLVDRGIGLLTTLAFGCIMILIQRPLFQQFPTLKMAALLMGTIALAAIAALALLFYRNIFQVIPPLQKLEQTRIGSIIHKAYDVVFFFRRHPGILTICIGISLFNLTCLTLACVCFAQSLQIDLPATDYFTMFPIITTLTAIPLTPGGLGIRESLFTELFKTIGVETYRTFPLSLLVYFGGLFCSLLGGLLYIQQLHRTPEIIPDHPLATPPRDKDYLP